jgi:nitrite reductase/ring-hydroxylating ferredoxin subunit/uncharacterized membrane protein
MSRSSFAHVLRMMSDRLESATGLDPWAQRLRAKLSFVKSAPIRGALSGSSLGHPLHPLLTDLPIGCWTGALLLDLTRGGDKGSRRLIGAGIVCALPTALAGLSDWMDTEDAEMRVGLMHFAGNLTGLSFLSVSWLRRQQGGRGLVTSAIGMTVIALSGWLGGHLSYALGVGVDTNAFDTGPPEWTAAGVLGEGEGLSCLDAGGVRIAAARSGGQTLALADRCSHRGGPLSEGTLVDGCVECPWHSSRFDLHTGDVTRGPASVPQPRYEVREANGVLEVRRLEQRALRRNPV